MKVFLDAGHGGKDPGALGNGMQEKNITLPVTLEIGEILKRHGVTVGYTRTTDTFMELSDRANKANNFGADIFVSIHCNAFNNSSAKGVETYSHIGSVKGSRLARSIQNSILSSKLYTVNRGTKTANFAVLRLTNMPAALVEMAFITNGEDANILKNRQNELAIAIAKGILSYLGILYKGGNTMTNTNDTPSEWAKEAMEWAKKEGICDGTRPKDAATREEVVTVLYRFSKKVK
jgi:N-acetylmuramoyl-L-alanine amidase